jgi:hypothetical protein
MAYGFPGLFQMFDLFYDTSFLQPWQSEWLQQILLLGKW